MSPFKKERDDQAHRRRETTNATARKDLVAWAMQLAPPAEGLRVLDLGCGTGKLALPYAEALGPEGACLGVDLAPESIRQMQDHARQRNLPHLDGRVGNLDAVVPELLAEGQAFDLVVSSYAVYYSREMVGLLRSVRKLLPDGGRMFLCGPGEGTNHEIADLIASVAPPGCPCPSPVPDYITPQQIDAVAADFASCKVHRLANAVTFTSAEDLLGWWRNHDMHTPPADAAVAAALDEHFATAADFTLTKNVLGVLFAA